jgi:hypothetical protein
MAAFKASRLVCSAMPRMTSSTTPMRELSCSNSCTTCVTCSTSLVTRLDGAQSLLDDLPASHALLIGLLRGLGGLGGTAGDLIDRAAHLIHGGGQIGDLALLLLLAMAD